MPTDIRKLNIDDLLGRLYYANVNHEWDEGDAIKAEIKRRIEVRDRMVKHLFDAQYTYHCDCGGGVEILCGDDDTMAYRLNGEQIL